MITSHYKYTKYFVKYTNYFRKTEECLNRQITIMFEVYSENDYKYTNYF